MATMEKLFMEIFERRDRIIEQLKQQKQLFDQHLASKLLINGVTPPPWLLSSSDFSHPPSSTNPSELKKAELISGLLLPHPRLILPHPNGRCSLYSKHVATATDAELPKNLCTGTSSPTEQLSVKSSGVPSLLQLRGTEDALSYVASTPQDKADEKLKNVHSELDQSLARIQRSRSRQKAFELRNSAKTGSKSTLGKENNPGVCASDTACGQSVHHIDFLECAKPSAFSIEHGLKEEVIEHCGKGNNVDDCNSVVEDSAVDSGSNLLGDAAPRKEVDVQACSPQLLSGMFVKPEKLDLDHVEESYLFEVPDSCPEISEKGNRPRRNMFGSGSGKSPVTVCSLVQEGTSHCMQDSIMKQQNMHSIQANVDRSSTQMQHDPLTNENMVQIAGEDLDCHPFHASPIGRDSIVCARSSSPMGAVEEPGNAFPESKSISASDSSTLKVAACLQLRGESVDVSLLNMHLEAADPSLINLKIDEQIDLSSQKHAHYHEGTQSPEQGTVDAIIDKVDADPAVSLPFQRHGGLLEAEQADVASSIEGITQASFSCVDCKAVTDPQIQVHDSLTSCRRGTGFERTSLIEITPAISGNDPEMGCRRAQNTELFHAQFLTDANVGSCSKANVTGVGSSRAQPVEKSGITNCCSSAIGFSWPQVKRRKIESELLSFKSAGTRSKDHLQEIYHANRSMCIAKHQSLGLPVQFSTPHNADVALSNSDFLDTGGQSDDAELLHIEDKPLSNMSENLLSSAQIIFDDGKFLLEKDDLDASVVSPQMEFMDVVGSDQITPMLEAFITNGERGGAKESEDSISFERFYLSSSKIEQASFLEQLCRSAKLSTPLSHFPCEDEYCRMPSIHHSLPNGLLEKVDLSRLPMDDSSDQVLEANSLGISGDINGPSTGKSYSDCPQLPSARLGWGIRRSFFSPIDKSFEGISSRTGGSDKLASSNPDLTCFRIEEDPESSDEHINMKEVEDAYLEEKRSGAGSCSVTPEPLRDITAEHINLNSDTAAEKHSSESISSETTDGKMPKRSIQKNGNCDTLSKGRDMETDDKSYSMGASSMKKQATTIKSRLKNPQVSGKGSLRREGMMLSEKEYKGKRDKKVKALEAAEAAKRHVDKRGIERKQKKEALELERARLKQENLRQMELQNKLKEEERMKSEADKASKRPRGEEERKEKEQKRKRFDEVWRQEREMSERALGVPKEHSGKFPGETWYGTTKCYLEEKKHGSMEEEVSRQLLKQLNSVGISQSNSEVLSIKDHKAATGSYDTRKGNEIAGCSTPICGEDEFSNIIMASQEGSYEISPYQGSEDDDEEVDERQNKKFIPTWGRRDQRLRVRILRTRPPICLAFGMRWIGVQFKLQT
ncbi:hypothetical protein Dimus_014450 [Dionaea muscipula]